MNENSPSVALIIRQCLDTMPYPRHDLIDYVKYAVKAAESLCDARVVNANLNRVHANFFPGLVPLGAELEFSNVGHLAVVHNPGDPKAFDPVYNGFKYFKDFCLDVLCWKLGGYVDDHTGETARPRTQGFLEMAPGRLNIEGELSRPATAAPWLLNQLICEIVPFYGIHPHSLHLSFQLRKNQINRQQVLPLSFVKCLLALGGGPELNPAGKFWISRMACNEITQQQDGEELIFARTSKRRWYVGDSDISNKTPLQTTAHVQQYKFMRLAHRTNYEPLIMCLKGLQLAYNPADYLAAEQLEQSRALREDYERLKEWALEPNELSPQATNLFLQTVRSGLMCERHHRPAHRLHYIDWALTAVDIHLKMFNSQLRSLRSGS
jgi:hypothetical protein